jgi:hypothetical protein
VSTEKHAPREAVHGEGVQGEAVLFYQRLSTEKAVGVAFFQPASSLIDDF